MKVAKKAKPELDCNLSRALRRKELRSLAGSLSVGDAKALRAAINVIRKNWH